VPSASRRNRCAAPRAPALERRDRHRAVDEDKKLVIFTVKASTFPNWDSAAQPRKIVVLNADEFINENAGSSVGGGAIVPNKYARAKQFVQYQLRVHFRKWRRFPRYFCFAPMNGDREAQRPSPFCAPQPDSCTAANSIVVRSPRRRGHAALT
jgi:hypothetical protein